MGFFDFFKSLFGGKPAKNDPLARFFESEYYEPDQYYKEIFEIAKAVSENDPEVVKAVRFALDEPVKYFRENAQRYLDRGMDFDNESIYDNFMVYDLLELASVDELEDRSYVSRVNLDCKLPEFRQGLAKIKNYEKIRSIAKALEFNGDGDIVTWTEELNAELDGKAYLAFIIEMVEEKFALVITDRETSEKINGETPDK